MAINQNVARLRRLLDKFLVENATINTLTTKTASGQTLALSSSTVGLDNTSALTVAGIQSPSNASGSWVKGLNTVVKNVDSQSGEHLSAGAIDSGAMYLPRNALVTKMTAVVTEDLAWNATATLTLVAGTSAGGEQFITGAAGNFGASGTSLVRGKGLSTDTGLSTALGGPSGYALFVADSLNFDTGGSVHMQVTASAAHFTDGNVSFICEFVYMGDDV